MTPHERFLALKLEIPPPPKPIGVYKPFLQLDDEVYVSGHGSFNADGTLINGRVGHDLSLEEGKLAAQKVGLAILATLIDNLGSLNKIERVVKVLGMVNCTDEFEKHPYVINGCSELFAEIWGQEKGVGVRSAVGFNSLPDNIPVEIEALFKIRK